MESNHDVYFVPNLRQVAETKNKINVSRIFEEEIFCDIPL